MTNLEAFSATFSSADGDYEIVYTPDSDKGFVDVAIRGMKMRWVVDLVGRDANSNWELGGLTRGTLGLWGDVYWFKLHRGEQMRVDYYADRVLWRTDYAAVNSDRRTD